MAASSSELAVFVSCDVISEPPAPGSGVVRYGNVVSKSAADTGAPSVNGTLPTGAFAGVHSPRSTLLPPMRQRVAQTAHHHAQRDVDGVVARTAAVREAGEIAAGDTEVALAAQPAAAGMPVLSRVISDAVTFDIWFTPGNPVRNAVTRSLRGRLLGARFAMFGAQRLVHRSAEQHVEQRRQRRVRHVGARTGRRFFGSLALKRSLSGRPITSSLTSGMPRRDTCTHGPPSTSGRANVGTRIQHARLAQACAGPATDHAVAAAGEAASCAVRARSS